jgi:hypothetical protein
MQLVAQFALSRVCVEWTSARAAASLATVIRFRADPADLARVANFGLQFVQHFISIAERQAAGFAESLEWMALDGTGAATVPMSHGHSSNSLGDCTGHVRLFNCCTHRSASNFHECGIVSVELKWHGKA